MFKSNDEFWRTVDGLIADLEKSGNAAAAGELKNGKSMVTGLTDGWADFLDSIEKVKKQYSSQLSSTQIPTLNNIHRAVYQRVWCNYRGPGWRIHARIQRMQGWLYKRRHNKKQRR